MRVDLQTQGLEAPEKSKSGRTARAAAAKTERATTVDQANLSFDRVRLHALASQAMAQPEVRGQKVESLRRAVAKGEYAVSGSQIADAVMADLCGGRKS